MELTYDDVIPLLSNAKKASANEVVADCPVCNKKQHFYIQSRHPFLYECKKCDASGNFFTLLKILGKPIYLVKKEVKIEQKLIPFPKKELEEQKNEDSENVILPKGFKRISRNEYLKSRFFIERNYIDYRIGITSRNSKFENYVIFSIDEDDICKGFVGRCFLEKQDFIQSGLKRYQNSKKTIFSNLLWGYDKISEKTWLVILVEGIFDAIRIINLYQFFDSEVVVCATFGKKVSPNQIKKLKLKSVNNVLLFHDIDAINITKKYALSLQDNFKNVNVTFMRNKKDPSSSEDKDILYAIQNSESVDSFCLNRITPFK